MLYGLLWLIAAPFVCCAWRRPPPARLPRRTGERFGRYQGESRGPYVWIHAVSVGETRAAAPLVEALRGRYPGRRILLTHMTPTGLAVSREIFGDTVERAWLPYDLGFAVRRFSAPFPPRRGRDSWRPRSGRA